MLVRIVEEAIQRIPVLEKISDEVAGAIHNAVLKGGEPTRKLADLLHGTWLGHPLHPVLTDVTIGAWLCGVFLDAVAVMKGDRGAARAADTLIAAGCVSAVPTALAGLADYSTIDKPASKAATLHALLNEVNLALFVLSLIERRHGSRRRGLFYSTLAAGLTLAAAWLGGHLVYGHNVGVDHNQDREGPARWTPALPNAELPEGTPKRVDVDGNAVLLYRLDGRVYAIGAVCNHAGGPLDEGGFEGCYVECPWHQSVFDLRDGRVRHGPATHPQPTYETRLRAGMVEVRQAGP
jgi:nitrite reductase/ring-hydroxylating ferredoxin subunit/uncharacterized membrane protein